MFTRNVMMPGGNILNHHRVRGIQHSLDDSTTIVEVESSDDAGSYEANWHYREQKLDLTFEQAEEWVKGLDFYAQYVNEEQERILSILTDEQAIAVADVFPEWVEGRDYEVGYRVLYEGVLYKCLQAHTSQADWTPDSAASLWARMLNPDPEVIPVWEQPDSTNAYMTGDKVHYPDADGPIYESTIDGNVWSPEAYPQGWRLVEGGE